MTLSTARLAPAFALAAGISALRCLLAFRRMRAGLQVFGRSPITGA